MLLGGTFCNIDDNTVKNFFSKTSHHVKSNDYFIFSIDSNNNEESLKKAYDNIWLEKLAFNTFLFFKNTFNVEGFDPKAFQYKYHWSKEKSEVQIILVSNKNQSFFWNNKQIKINTDQEFHIITSKKRTLDFFTSNLKENNFKLLETLGEEEQKLKLCIAKLL